MLLSGSVARLLLRQPSVLQRKTLTTLLNKSSNNLLRASMMQPCALNRLAANDASVQWPESHASHFKIERLWAAAMIPLIPASYFIHGPFMDTALSVAIALHIHWGIQGVVQDYARPFVIGETMAAAARASVYVITALLLAGLFHFNYNDVGLTKAFEMVWSL